LRIITGTSLENLVFLPSLITMGCGYMWQSLVQMVSLMLGHLWNCP
jgi:hypothetical protein